MTCTSQYQITVKYILDIAGGGLFIGNVNTILLKESLVLYNQELNMQNQFGNQDLVIQNDRIDCFKRLMLLKENIIPRPILLYNSTLFEKFIVSLLQGFGEVSILLTC